MVKEKNRIDSALEAEKIKAENAQNKKVKTILRHVLKNVKKGKDEMPAQPGFFRIPILHDGELEAIQSNLQEKGITVIQSERSHYSDDTGDRLRVTHVEDQ